MVDFQGICCFAVTDRAMKLNHRLKRMSGRDVNEENRVSTPLELFFDLTFAVSLTTVAQQLSRLLAQGEIFAALFSFTISMLSICLLNYLSLLNWNWYCLFLCGPAIVPLAISLVMGKMNFSIPACLAVLAVSPFAAIIGFGTLRSRRLAPFYSAERAAE
jgi:hypothetical protein